MLAIDVISRVIHVATAITLIGGSVFLLLVLLPAAKVLSEEAHAALADAVRGIWKKFVHAGIALFLISGFYNYMQSAPKHDGDGLYHALVGTKILLALGVFFIASALVGRSARFEAMRNARKKWLGVLVLLAAIIVGISGFVKVRGIPAVEASQETALRQIQPVATETQYPNAN